MSAQDIILGAIALEAVAIGLLLVATLLTQARKAGSRTRRHRQLWEEALPHALSGDQAAIARIRDSLHSRCTWSAFHAFIDEKLRDRDDRSRRKLGFRRLSRLVGLTERLQNELTTARDPLSRAAAGKTLARLQERIAEDEILRLLDSKDTAVVLAAAYGTVSFRDGRRFLQIFRAVYDRTPMTLHGAAELLSGLGDGVCPVIHGLLVGVLHRFARTEDAQQTGDPDPLTEVDCSDSAAQVVMVDILAYYRYVPAGHALAQLLSLSQNEEVLIHLAKALAIVGDHSAVPRLIELLGHPNWVIRRQSTLALAALGAGEAAESLQPLIADSSLAVRISAQEALMTLGRPGSVAADNVLEAVS